MKYQDFLIQLRAAADRQQGFAVHVRSPAGDGAGDFQLPFERADEEAALLADLRRGVPCQARSADHLRRIGALLYQALFRGDVERLYHRSLGIAAPEGLRIRLSFDLNRPQMARLHSLPWEFLLQPQSGDFLGLGRMSPVVRYLEVPRPPVRIPLPRPLRVLAAASSPAGLSPLDLEKECREIRKAFEGWDSVEVSILRAPSLGRLRERLVEGSFHVLHFMGHGDLDEHSGQGRLYFQAPDGTPQPVSGPDLAAKIQDAGPLRLAVVNACETARLAEDESLNPFAGVAAALVLAGLPAVVAMQFPLTDRAALDFSRALYRRLAAGDPLDAAVAEGRQSIHSQDPVGLQWGAPVLFSRLPEGNLFELQPEARAEPEGGKAEAAPSSRRRVLLAAGAAAAIAIVLLFIFEQGSVGLMESFLADVPWPVMKPDLEKVQVGSLMVARYEVSNAEYLAFVRAQPKYRRGRLPEAEQDEDYLKHWVSWNEYPPGEADYPVTRVSWYAAAAFCRWMGGSLPSIDQWKAAAHADEGLFPWGEEYDYDNDPAPANYCDRECNLGHRGAAISDGYPETAPVHAFPEGKTREGVFNLSGNVWEWCSDVSRGKRAAMGGSFRRTLYECSTDDNTWEDARLCAPDGGFRCIWPVQSRPP